MGADCMEEADVEGMTYCWAYSEYNECTGEESCYAYVTVDGVDMEGDCDELEQEHDDDWYYDDCSDEGYDYDCFDMVVDYVENLESCSYFESCTECWVTAIADGEEVSGTCDEMSFMYDIPSDYDDEECWVMDDVMGEDCVEEADVEGMTYCWAYTEYNECTGEESCYAYVTVDGVDMEGDCDELAGEHDDEWYSDESTTGDDEDCWESDMEGEDCMEEADVEGMTYCWAYVDYNSCTGEE